MDKENFTKKYGDMTTAVLVRFVRAIRNIYGFNESDTENSSTSWLIQWEDGNRMVEDMVDEEILCQK